jgi:hypothetical protein
MTAMNGDDVRQAAVSQIPPTPEVLQGWIRQFGGEAAHALGDEVPLPGTAAWDALERSAREALKAALARPEADRAGAHALLAADALLTTWAQAAAHADDPDAELEAQIRAIASLREGA